MSVERKGPECETLHVAAGRILARIFQDISDSEPSIVSEAGPPAVGALVVVGLEQVAVRSRAPVEEDEGNALTEDWHFLVKRKGACRSAWEFRWRNRERSGSGSTQLKNQ